MSTSASQFPNNLPHGWKEKLSPVTKEPFFKDLTNFLKKQYEERKTIYPARENVLRALQSVDFDAVKVVIIGQDPYHGPQQAIGLSFAVPNELRRKPPSLQNIFKELESDLHVKVDHNKSDLKGWVEQGVLLLNTVLTVEAAKPLSHRDRGWEKFTDLVIQKLAERKKPVAFILWGNHAQKFKAKINPKFHAVIESPHPSPLSAHRGFFGSKPFSKANECLKKLGETPIDWPRI
ncbi:MAG: uracil-DNA glycosylase [Bdellovibrionales bacterium]|nr:uracil-DNA glycosylase [Bdellovibrionales bacterium]